MDARPRARDARSRKPASACSISSRTRRADRSNSSPSAVNATWRVLRSNSRTPSSASSFHGCSSGSPVRTHAPSPHETPARGKDMSFVEQIFGNISNRKMLKDQRQGAGGVPGPGL